MATTSLATSTTANTNNHALSSSSVDTNLLRNAIRLIQCIQKERGSSCAYCADNVHFENAMIEARTSSDISAGLMLTHNTGLPVQSNLAKIRNLIAKHKNSQDSDDTLALHRIFVCFNTLISSLVHDCVLKQVSAGRKECKSTIKNRHKRGLSFDINDKLSSAFTITPETGRIHKTEPLLSTTPPKSNLTTLHSIRSTDDSDDDYKNSAPPPPPIEISPSRRKVQFARPTSKVQQLLDVLHIFVQLKESAGIERAILSSLLAFRSYDDSLRMFMNDLILVVENQRSLVHQLEQLPDGQHRNLVLDLAQMSPELLELQTIILTNFKSLQNAEYDAEIIWDLITLYVDKLHSVELLIIEELECSLPAPPASIIKRTSSSGALSALLPPMNSLLPPMNNGQQQQQKQKELQTSTITSAEPVSEEHRQAVYHAIEDIFPVTEDNGSRNLISEIEKMSADELKRRVLEVLRAEEESSDVSQSSDAPVSHQYSAAANLNEDMNKALLQSPPSRAASKEWDISIYEIKFTKRIGQGASATTYLATWTGQKVAVKVASITKFGQDGWRTEVAALQRLHHPNIIRLLGSVYNENPLTYCLVLEYCNAGDLATALKYPTPRNFFFHVAFAIANAMAYLHSRNVIHRDLKPGNVLCDGNIASGNFTVKVTDFGVATEAGARMTDTNASGGGVQRNLTGETGTYRWMAPEVIRHEAYSTMADVYSFAIMVWQFLTHEEPFLDVSAMDAARLAAIEKERPPMPENTPKAIADLIQVNWSDKPSERWEFSKVTEILKEIQNGLSAEDKTFLESSYGHPVYEYDELEVEDVNVKQDPKAGKKGHGKPSKIQDNAQKRGSKLLSNFFGSSKKADKQKRKPNP